MDKETQYKLDKIGKHIGKMAKDLVREAPTEHYKMAMDIANNKNLSKEVRDSALRSIESGGIPKYETIIDKKKEKELSDRMDYEIKKGLRDGSIKPAQDDHFSREMREKMKR